MSVTILTVEDSRTMRDMLRMALVEAGFRVVQAEDGLHGLDVLRQEAPQVVITDINMPRMDGFGFIEAVRQDDHCLARDAHELGIHALAVPLRNMQGRTLAALKVVGTPEQLSDAAVQRKWLPLLLDAARELRPLL